MNSLSPVAIVRPEPIFFHFIFSIDGHASNNFSNRHYVKALFPGLVLRLAADGVLVARHQLAWRQPDDASRAVWRINSQLTRPSSLTILCPDSLRPIWQACPWVDHVIGMAGKTHCAAEVKAVRKLRPGIAIVLPNSFGSALGRLEMPDSVRIGRAGRWRSWLLTAHLPEWPRGERRRLPPAVLITWSWLTALDQCNGALIFRRCALTLTAPRPWA